MKLDTSALKLESGVPLTTTHKQTKWSKFFDSARNGDSFMAPITSRAALYHSAKHAGVKLISRKIDAESARYWILKGASNDEAT